MRWTEFFIPTMKEVPHDAEIPSHQLMLRAGLIRKLSGGLYTYLPAGLRSLRKVQTIIREEMDRAGALETLMPALQPKEIWEKTGRYESLADVMFKIQDRQDRGMVLGPTHEEVITDLVSREVNSYKQLPINFYQIQTKFRDEIRPRFGLMRAKEFIMKDAYSFDTDWEAVSKSYQAMYDAYTRIFKRCGLTARAVEADTGAMGGDASHEFMVVADAGEDGIVECETCGYAANLEKARRGLPEPAPSTETIGGIELVDTPNVRTIDEVHRFFDVDASKCLKTLIYKSGEEFLAVVVAGDREVNECKLAKLVTGGSPELANAQEIQTVTGAPQGFSGPVNLKIRVYADEALKSGGSFIAGANEADKHIKHVSLERDVDTVQWVDVSEARAGDACPKCDAGVLREIRGIEVGHVFQLGTKYSESLGANYLDKDGKQKPMIMGCYGIGVSRTLQAVLEQHHDDMGILWPASVAPFTVEIIPLNTKHEESMKVAEELTKALEAEGIDVLLDDRNERAGFKFKDADLIGIPLRVAIGERSLKEGKIELKYRSESDREDLPLEGAADEIIRRAKKMLSELSGR